MEKNALNDLYCEQVKNYMKSLIDEIPCDKIIPQEHSLENILLKSITYSQALDNKILLHKYFGEDFSYSFVVNMQAMNKMIDDNNQTDYMHIFFINKHANGLDRLDIIFRFSNTEIYSSSSDQLSAGEKVYERNLGNTIEFQPNFSTLAQAYQNGIGKQAAAKPSTILTEYITFEMKEMLNFKGFEHNLVFELMCRNVNGQNRLGLQVLIQDVNRTHSPFSNIAYYDLGNIRP